jgi:hypothetical protein
MANQPPQKTADEIMASFCDAIKEYAADDESGPVRDCCRELIRHGHFDVAASTMAAWVKLNFSRETRARTVMATMALEAYFIPHGNIAPESVPEFERNDEWRKQISTVALDESKFPVAVLAVADRMNTFMRGGN